MAVSTMTVASPSRDSTASVIAKGIVATDTHLTFACPKSGKFLIYLHNESAADPAIIKVYAGTGLHASQGAMSITIAKSTGDYVIGPLSTSRFKSVTSGNAWINMTQVSATTGTMAVLAVP